MLETIWFILWGVLWAVYFMLDGFDLGLGTLLPFIARDEAEKRAVYQSLGPYWDGNEVWLITAGGVTFAAFPTAYAVMFSSLYTPLMLVLFSLILRGVSVEYRNKVDSPGWRKIWDIGTFVGSVLPAILLGVAFANIFEGLPLTKEGILEGGLPALLNPYGLLGGVVFLVLFVMHALNWLVIKSSGALETRARRWARALWPVVLVGAAGFLVATAWFTPLYNNYLAYPVLFILPLAAVAAVILMRLYMAKFRPWLTWASSAALIVFATLFGVVGLYPNLLPSTLDPAATLTAFNAASSPLTLKIMLAVALIMVPIVIVYQTWVYHHFRLKVQDQGSAFGDGVY
ncbi:MAG: cytochrome d ubiquinol oxidase subunit II [Deltaproteobacteria bacterium]|nr:cytochrome d ubiquinol oxidase subunit II [Deltaproteobacteria bacterium]